LPYRIEAGYLTLARVSIAQDQVEAVLDLLHRLQQAAESDQRTGSLIEILVLCALARWAQGDPTGALADLERALTLAEPENYCRVFLDEGKAMAELLRQARRGLLPDYVDKLLAAFPTDESRQWAPDLLPEPLSERELEVLQLVATGASNQDIAGQLFIALSTVKKHVGNILVKLDTPNRVQAIARARELGLLP
jgi:LuxR family maltose regulon positive regulatory protein